MPYELEIINQSVKIKKRNDKYPSLSPTTTVTIYTIIPYMDPSQSEALELAEMIIPKLEEFDRKKETNKCR